MKKLIFLITILFIAISLQGQDIIRENGYVKIKESLWDAFRDSAVVTKHASMSKDTIISDMEIVLKNNKKQLENADTIISNRQAMLDNCQKQIDIVLPSEKKESIVSWGGFYAGYMAGYNFSDSIISKTTLLGGLQHNLFGEANIKVRDFIIQPGIIIPLSNRPVSIYAKVGYLLF